MKNAPTKSAEALTLIGAFFMGLELAAGDVLAEMTDTEAEAEESDQAHQDDANDVRNHRAGITVRGSQCGHCGSSSKHNELRNYRVISGRLPEGSPSNVSTIALAYNAESPCEGAPCG